MATWARAAPGAPSDHRFCLLDGIAYPVHPLQITAMGMLAADSLNLEDLADACAREQRREFLGVLAPLRVPKATGSPFNPIAVM
jgi:hypothetical protein